MEEVIIWVLLLRYNSVVRTVTEIAILPTTLNVVGERPAKVHLVLFLSICIYILKLKWCETYNSLLFFINIHP